MKALVNKAIQIYQDNFEKFTTVNKVIAFTGGKDSTVLLELAKMAFGKVPCDAFYIDSELDHDETAEFIEKACKHWRLNLVKDADQKTLNKIKVAKSRDERAMLARILKIETIKLMINKYKYGLITAGIRWDEHEARSEAQYVEKRKDHVRLHPILHFTEKDIWQFINDYKIPYNPLYDQGYKSLGEKEFTHKVGNPDDPERAGREPDKEKLMKRLRQLGYF